MRIVPASVRKLSISFNPVPYEGLTLKDSPELVKLKAVQRFVDIDKIVKTIRFYVELTDNKNTFTLEIPYFLYLAIGKSETVTCRHYKLEDSMGNVKYHTLEISEVDKPELTFSRIVKNPLEASNSVLQDDYCNKFRESTQVDRVLNEVSPGFVVPCVSTGKIINGNYMRVPVGIKDMLSGARIEIQYRKLFVINDDYIVDLEGVCS